MSANPNQIAKQAFNEVRQALSLLENKARLPTTGGLRLSNHKKNQAIKEQIQIALSSLDRLEQVLGGQEEEHQQLLAIQQVSQAITSSLDLQRVLNMVMDTIIQLTGAERGFLMLLNPESGDLVIKVARNFDRETIQKSSFKISRSIVRQVARKGKPIVTTNAQADPRFRTHESVVSYNLRSILCVPLKVREELIGVIYADNRAITGLFDFRDRDLLAAFANQAAVAIQNARLFERVTEQLEAITSMKNLMDNVFASIVSGVVTTDEEDRIVLMNRAAESMLAVSSSRVRGCLCRDSLPALCTLWPDMVASVKREGVVKTAEFETNVGRRGTANFKVQLSPLRDAQQKTLGVAMVVDDLTEKRRRERTISHVRRYLSPALVDSLPDVDKLQLGGLRRTISILFGDVRGFSAFSEEKQPELVVDTINRYFTIAADAILLHEGIIDKFMGDAVMALFNTPFLSQADHAMRAIRTALAIQYDVNALQKSLPPNQYLQMGIGIHTGEAVLGNIGSPDRLDYSAIGDAVNVAKRLQESAGPGQILISQAVFEQTRDWIEAAPLEPVRFKGRQTAEQVYELVGLFNRKT
ncbi:MAG: GAF domain-containing protein [Anaerolineales bacterium]|nr:GAF domain-containing protein [Anaerolineales bacterium]